MKKRPILFNAPMVRALVNGSKTQTRRVITHKGGPVPSWATFGQELDKSGSNLFRWSEEQTPGQPLRTLRRWPVDKAGPCAMRCPHGQPGDQLWVRETFAEGVHQLCDSDHWVYAADPFGHQHRLGDKWKPSIFMPRAASRITLEIVSVHVERLQDISEADAVAEGIPPISSEPCDHHRQSCADAGCWGPTAKNRYGYLWESINGPGSWDLNPWVWVVEFKKVAP